MTREQAKVFLLQLHTDKQLNKSEHEALRVAIKTLEKQKAISELQPPTDDWDSYADRLYDLAYLSGYNDGLIAKEGKNTDGDNKPKLTH